MLSTIDIPDFIAWAMLQKGYAKHEGKLTFYKFYFARLDKAIQNSQIKKYQNHQKTTHH